MIFFDVFKIKLIIITKKLIIEFINFIKIKKEYSDYLYIYKYYVKIIIQFYLVLIYLKKFNKK